MRVFVSALVAFTSSIAISQPRYSAEVIPEVGGLTNNFGRALSESGEAAGFGTLQGQGSVPWHYANSVLRDLRPYLGSAEIRGINSSGVMVGRSVQGAFYFIGTTQYQLTILGQGPGHLYPQAISDAGYIAACSSASYGYVHNLNTGLAHGLNHLLFPSTALPYAVNNFGQSAGTSHVDAGIVHPVRWNSQGQAQDLGTLGGNSHGHATGINDLGDVVGWSNGVPFVYRDGQLLGIVIPWLVLPFDTADARDINNNRVVIGDSSGLTNKAFVWTEERGATELTTLLQMGIPYQIVDAFAINDAGTILTKNSQGQHVLLHPIWVPQELSAFALIQGFVLGGGLPELIQSDNNYLEVSPNYAVSRGVSPLQVIVEANLPTAAPLGLRFVVELSANTAGIAQKIFMFNYSANDWEQVDTRIAATTDTTVEIRPKGSLARFIKQGTGQVKTKITFDQVMVGPRWRVSLDRVSWLLH